MQSSANWRIPLNNYIFCAYKNNFPIQTNLKYIDKTKLKFIFKFIFILELYWNTCRLAITSDIYLSIINEHIQY